MKIIIEYNKIEKFNDILDIDNCGEFYLQIQYNDGGYMYFGIYTQYGLSHQYRFGPVSWGGEVFDRFEYIKDSFEFDERKIIKNINLLINKSGRDILGIEFMDKQEFFDELIIQLNRISNDLSYMKEESTDD